MPLSFTFPCHAAAVRRLCVFAAATAAVSVELSGCSLIDDFGKFHIVAHDGEDDAGEPGDSGAFGDAAVPCGADDCARLNSDCERGECRNGQCVSAPIPDGRACGDDKCRVCQNGRCDAPKDCSAFDGVCARGECNPSDGLCLAVNANEGKSCFDNDPCTVDETCKTGECSGKAKDCSGLDDQCSEGLCDPESGNCALGDPSSSKTCDDFNPCTINDQCDASGLCIAPQNATPGTACSDFNTCTGTALASDTCDGQGECQSGMPVLVGTECDDDNECTGSDACNATGACTGSNTREGSACETACKTDNTCQAGACLDGDGEALGFKAGCYFNWCDSESICQDRWQRDGACDCGCDFVDPDCNDCSARMCEPNAVLQHRAATWCDSQGDSIGTCPESLKGDGKCDCGCQFVDPDCSGGSCCAPTGEAGCENAFVEDCVCKREGAADASPECCDQEWGPRCVQLAQDLGCMTCD